MPIYEFHCCQCDHEIEVLVRGSEQPACPDCGGQQLTRLLSLVASPGRENSGSTAPEPPAGPCGASCGCFPPA